MTRLRVSLRVPVGRPLPALADFVTRCEAAGFDGVGIHDHPSSGRDVYVALALAARATRRLALFPATSSPIVRHPLLLASLAHSLEELAPGRARLTMAPGFISTRSIGKPRGTVAAMREAVRDVRRLLAGEAVGFGPTETRLRNRSAVPTPVFLLAAGPRMTELAGEVADGAFLMVGLDAAAIRAARGHLAEGARRAGRSPRLHARWRPAPRDSRRRRWRARRSGGRRDRRPGRARPSPPAGCAGFRGSTGRRSTAPAYTLCEIRASRRHTP